MLVDALHSLLIMEASLFVVVVQINILLSLIVIVKGIVGSYITNGPAQTTVRLGAIKRGIVGIVAIVRPIGINDIIGYELLEAQ